MTFFFFLRIIELWVAKKLNPYCKITSFFALRIAKLYLTIKGIVHFEINFWYVLAYLKGIQDVDVFVSTVFSFHSIFNFDIFVVRQSYNAVLGVHLKEHAQRSQN